MFIQHHVWRTKSVRRDDAVTAQTRIDCFSEQLAPHKDAMRITFDVCARVICPDLSRSRLFAAGANGLGQIYFVNGNDAPIDQFILNTMQKVRMEYKEIALFYAVHWLCINIGTSTSVDHVNWPRMCGHAHATDISKLASSSASLPPTHNIVRDSAALGYKSNWQFDLKDFSSQLRDCFFSLLSNREITVQGSGYEEQVRTVLTCETIAMSGFSFVSADARANTEWLSSPARNAIAAAMTWIRLACSSACFELAQAAIAHLGEPWITEGRPVVYAPPAAVMLGFLHLVVLQGNPLTVPI
jgi:hypothetical protein